MVSRNNIFLFSNETRILLAFQTEIHPVLWWTKTYVRTFIVKPWQAWPESSRSQTKVDMKNESSSTIVTVWTLENCAGCLLKRYWSSRSCIVPCDRYLQSLGLGDNTVIRFTDVYKRLEQQLWNQWDWIRTDWIVLKTGDLWRWWKYDNTWFALQIQSSAEGQQLSCAQT